MTGSNADLVREALELYRREGFAALAPVIDPQIEIRMGFGLNQGEYLGLDQALAFNADWEDVWGAIRYEIGEIEAVDDQHLVVRIETTLRGEGSGAEVNATQWWLIGVRDGRFVRWHLYDDRDRAVAAAREP